MASFPQTLRAAALRSVAGDAAIGAAALLALAGLALLALRERIRTDVAVVAAAALIAADLLRAGAGLNPTAPGHALHALAGDDASWQRGCVSRAGGSSRAWCRPCRPSVRLRAVCATPPSGARPSRARRLSPYANVRGGGRHDGRRRHGARRRALLDDDGRGGLPGPGHARAAAGERRALRALRAAVRQRRAAAGGRRVARRRPHRSRSTSTSSRAAFPTRPCGRTRTTSTSSGEPVALEGATARYVDVRPGFVRVAVTVAARRPS